MSAANAAANRGKAQPRGEKRTNRSKKGQQNSGQGQQSNKGNNNNGGQSQGDKEGSKKTRGIAGIILAVPMADQLTGTLNKGRTNQFNQRLSPSRQSSSTQGQVETRGQFQGDVGQIPQQPSNAWQNQTVKRFFLRQQEQAPAKSGHDNH